MNRNQSKLRTRSAGSARRPARMLLAGLLAGATLLGGCASNPQVAKDWRGKPFFQPTNFLGPETMPLDVRRVAVLPPAGLDGFSNESTAGIRAALSAAVARAGRFETVTVSAVRWAELTGKSGIASTDALAPEWFEALEREFGVDAVLFTDVTEFRAYAPLALGVRCKLARIGGDRSVVWSFDTVFDSRNPAVANSARRHASAGEAGPSANDTTFPLQSPTRFAEYAFDATFTTLPSRKSALKRP